MRHIGIKHGYILLIAILFFAFGISACHDEEDIIDTKLIVEIDSVPVEFYDPISGTETLGMWVKVDGNSDWEVWSQTKIDGFTFEEGYYTKLEINKSTDKKLFGWDGGSPNSYRLLKTLDKKKSESIRTR